MENKTSQKICLARDATASLDLEFKEFFSRSAIINAGLRLSHFTFKSK